MLGAGCWVLGAGCWVLGAGCWVLGAGCWVLGAGRRKLTTKDTKAQPLLPAEPAGFGFSSAVLCLLCYLL
ncbi:MAG: hypothetical protein ACI856_001691 [Kiritimatiellia bacterium]